MTFRAGEALRFYVNWLIAACNKRKMYIAPGCFLIYNNMNYYTYIIHTSPKKEALI